MIQATLDAIDEAASGFIRLAYLLAGITAVAVYFGAGHLPADVEGVLNALLPWALAAAIETHTYLSARRVRAGWQGTQSAGHGSEEWRHAWGALRVNLGILAGLLAFSCWNQLNYLLATWQPPAAALGVPPWVAYVVRALVVPIAFMAAAFLAPMGEGLPAQVQAEARRFAASAFRVARKQWRRRLAEMERHGEDVTAALVQLVDDPGERRVIATIHEAMYPSTRGLLDAPTVTDGSLALASRNFRNIMTEVDLHKPAAPERPPTGPGSPVVARASKHATAAAASGPALQLVAPAKWSRGRHKRTASAEQRVRRVLDAQPAVSTRQLAKLAHVSDSTASKHRALWRKDHAQVSERSDSMETEQLAQ